MDLSNRLLIAVEWSVIYVLVLIDFRRVTAAVRVRRLLTDLVQFGADRFSEGLCRSEAEFVSKLGGGAQEADESQMWLELLREECGVDPQLTTPLEQEADELMAILTTIIRRTADGKAES